MKQSLYRGKLQFPVLCTYSYDLMNTGPVLAGQILEGNYSWSCYNRCYALTSDVLKFYNNIS